MHLFHCLYIPYLTVLELGLGALCCDPVQLLKSAVPTLGKIFLQYRVASSMTKLILGYIQTERKILTFNCQLIMMLKLLIKITSRPF